MTARRRTPGPLAPGPHRIELVHAKRDRRVELVVAGDLLIRSFGRSDGPWAQTTRRLADLEAALGHAALRQKVLQTRGYVEAGRSTEFEAAIAKDPDDPAGYLVYADWLASRGDPLGELITVASALDERPDDLALANREQELLGAHALSLADFRWRSWPLRYRFGFVEGWELDHEIEKTMKVGDALDLFADYPNLRLPGNWWWSVRQQLVAIWRHRCGIFVRRVYTPQRRYAIRRANERWLLERVG